MSKYENFAVTSARKAFAVAGLALTLTTLAIPSVANAAAQTAPAQFVPFNKFLENTKAASSSDFLSRPQSQLKQPAALDEMRSAILERYKGVEVTHSFLLDGQHYDCVPTHQQPAFRTYGLKSAAQAPPVELLKHSPASPKSDVQSAASPDLQKSVDAVGNSIGCAANTVPLLRTTLETMSRFGSLKEFYRKTPGNAVRDAQANLADPSRQFANPAIAAHKYSYTYQYVNNLGGNSNLNIWSPYVNTARGQIFSLSQQWYIGGSGAGTQTEEVGWVVYPAMFGNDQHSHFFIFSTGDNYATGCWNNSCGDFVQVASSGLLGARLGSQSVFGGAQYEFSAEYYLYQGNWWLAYNGTWVGYYPGSKYHGGQNSRYAQIVEYGSESVGTTSWPGEGSGYPSSWGFGYSAFQRNLWYINTSGGGVWETLTPVSPSPACYTITGPYNNTGLWTRYFYEGGYGGTGC